MNRLCVLIKNFDLTRIQYISIASPGLNGSGGYVKLAFNVPLTTVNIVKELHKKLQKKIPIYLTGDVASAGVGELVMGIGKRIKQFFILKIGTGINLCYVDGGNFR
jgi:predicted NBD/HSP70 family sugar kinase